MNKVSKTLKSYLLKILDSSITEVELTDFVHVCRSIVQPYLLYFRSSVFNLCTQQGLTITDLAYDCIAEAFAKDDKNKYHKLENFVKSLNNDLETTPEIEIFLAFKSFITKIADAELARLYAQSDPYGAKIHRNMRDCLKRSKILLLKRDSRGYVVRPVDCDCLDCLQPFPPDELENRFFARVNRKHSMPDLLDVFHQVIKEQNTYKRSVPLIELVQIIKKVYYDGYGDLTDETLPTIMENLSEFEIEQIRGKVENGLKEKILFTYLAHGKVNCKQAEAMFNAFQDLFDDWCSGGDANASLLNYLRRHYPMTEDEYEKEFRAKMEYVLKIAREDFAARLMREI